LGKVTYEQVTHQRRYQGVGERGGRRRQIVPFKKEKIPGKVWGENLVATGGLRNSA